MKRFTLSISDKRAIYKIYWSCRVCGTCTNYRRPIIVNVNLDESNLEFRQRIEDCLQLEITPDDKMPPLICEICYDKVNDFYEFKQLAQQTDIRIRRQIGLPLRTARKMVRIETENTETQRQGGSEPHQYKTSKKGKAGPKCSKKSKEEESINVEEEVLVPSQKESRSSSVARPSKLSKPTSTPSRDQPSTTPKLIQQFNPATPQPSRNQNLKTTKVTQATYERNNQEKKVQEKDVKEKESKKPSRVISRKELQDLLEDTANFEDNSLLVPRAQKRVREHEIPKPLVIPKRSKPTPKEPVEPAREPTPPRPKPRPKSRQDPKNLPTTLVVPKKAKPEETPPPPKIEPPKIFTCTICNMQLKTVQALANHTKHNHVPSYTKPQNACNPCGKWFPATEEANTHHRYHRASTFPYHCRRCLNHYTTLPEYDLHISNNKCVPWETVPDVKCEECWKTFPTDNLRKAHKCAGIDSRPGGKCSKCPKTYATLKSLKKHESTCNQRRKRDLIADPDVLRRLKPMQVRISRCDGLLARGGRVDVSALKPNYGLDRHYVYPYMKYKMKSTNKGKLKCKRESYTNWDSEASDDDSTHVHRLSTMCIKMLLSKNLIGKVPIKLRKIKNVTDIDIIKKEMGSLDTAKEDVKYAPKNELLMASLNDIIGVPQMEAENVSKDVSNDCTILDKKSEISKESANRVNAENSYTESDPSDRNKIDDFNTTSVNRVLNQNETRSDIENISKITGNDDVDRNENDVKLNYCNTALAENSKVFNENDTQSNAEDTADDVMSDRNRAQRGKSEISEQNYAEEMSKNTENYNVDRNEIDKAALSENIELLNKNDQYLDEDTGNADVNKNDVNTNESVLRDSEIVDKVLNENTEDNSNDRLMRNEPVVSIENYNISTNNSEDKSENALNDGVHNEFAPSEVFSISDVSTKLQLETDSDHNNEIVNTCDNEVTDKQDLIDKVENNSENKTENRIESEHMINFKNIEVDLETHVAALVRIESDSPVNGINNQDNETEQNNSKINECNQEKIKIIEVNNVTTKESPIKHSIENIIGDPDKNPEKYIDEVISSLENIIMKNPRTEESAENVNGEIKVNDIDDQNVLDALDAQIGEERKNDNDKITLEDLLTKEHRPMELDDISDDDFHFDA